MHKFFNGILPGFQRTPPMFQADFDVSRTKIASVCILHTVVIPSA